MGVPFAHLLLLAPVLNADWLVGFNHICDLEFGIHLLEEEAEFVLNNGSGIFFVCVDMQEREVIRRVSIGSFNAHFIFPRCHLLSHE